MTGESIHINFCRNLVDKCKSDSQIAEYNLAGKCVQPLTVSTDDIEPKYTQGKDAEGEPTIVAEYSVKADASLDCPDNKLTTTVTMTCDPKGKLDTLS